MTEDDTVEVSSERLEELIDGYLSLVEEVEELKGRVNGMESNVMESDEMSSTAHRAATDAAERVEKTRVGQRRLKDQIEENQSSTQENSYELQHQKRLIEKLFERQMDDK